MTGEKQSTMYKQPKRRENEFYRDFRDKAFENSQLGKELNVLKQDKVGICRKSFRLLRVRIYEDHTILSVFQHAEGTNFSTRERIACLFIYMIAVTACSAM